jgi:putative peptide zinc metalloprotease protein
VHTQPGERGWLVFYAVASFFYRLFIATVIIVFVAGRFFTIGILLAIWVSFVMLALPLGKVIRFVLFNPVLRKNRNRSIVISGAVATGLLALLFVVPMPFLTRAEGIVWLPEQAHVRAGTAGFVERIEAVVGEWVTAGDVLLVLRDPELRAERETIVARRDELEVRYRAERASSFVDARITADEIAAVDKRLARLDERVERLTIRAGVDGLFAVASPGDLPGRFLNQGDGVGYVIGRARPRVRAVVTPENVDLIRNQTVAVSMRLASRVPDTFPVEFLREVPAATNQLPSAALSRQGGGEIANDPSAGRDDIAFQAVFQFEFLLPASMEVGRYGERVYVRFDHGFAPLWSQWYRRLKLLFLRLLDD